MFPATNVDTLLYPTSLCQTEETAAVVVPSGNVVAGVNLFSTGVVGVTVVPACINPPPWFCPWNPIAAINCVCNVASVDNKPAIHLAAASGVVETLTGFAATFAAVIVCS